MKVYELHVGEPDTLGPLNACCMPECLDDVALQMETLASFYDHGIAHKEADRLLLLTLTMIVNDDELTADDHVAIRHIHSTFNKIRKDYI